MKRTIALITSSLLTFCSLGTLSTLPVFAETAAPVISSAEDITLESICDAATYLKILEKNKIFSISTTYSNTGDEYLEGINQKITVADSDGTCQVNEYTEYADGYISNCFYSNDESDPYFYSLLNGESFADMISAEEISDLLENPSFGISAEGTALTSVTQEGDNYTAVLESTDPESSTIKQTVTLEASTGKILKIESEYSSVKGEGNTICIDEFDYSEDQTIDLSPKTSASVPEESNDISEDNNSGLKFETTDINGETVTDEILKTAKLIMVNYWEPWCGPCVQELPDLQKLYENYKDKGLLILGVYSSIEDESDAKSIIERRGITYPILNSNEAFAQYAENYYPSTIFVDSNGKLLTDDSFANARSYEEWEEIINSFGLLD